jgi:NAD(P)H-dependent flavin oxidoreductase YrpB (nitropropane dioxygenase family)
MGIAISGWPLARAVSRAGQLGVVSGTAIDAVFARRLQNEGVSDALRAVLDRFPVQSIVERVLHQFAQTRRAVTDAYQNLVMLTHRSSEHAHDLLVLAAYAEVALAKDGHDGRVGMNLLTKVQVPTAPTLLGAILADADYVVMGAGVPTHIPGALARLADGEPVDMPLDVVGDEPSTRRLRFVPERYLPSRALHAPKFLGVVSSHVLATALAKRSNGPVEGFVVERPNAGGHNAPPRGAYEVDARGEPIYGPRDEVKYDAMVELGRPFWIGGGVTHARDVTDALALGATGVQVGTLFAYCDESGMEPTLRSEMLKTIAEGDVAVSTSLRASSTGYPFKIVDAPGSIADPAVYASRTRKCDLGYLREAYAKADGTIGYRCSAEPVSAYVRKGGDPAATEGSACLCNGLMATCGLGQVRSDGRVEPALLTSGDSLNDVRELLGDRSSYSATDVIDYLGAELTPPA